MVKKWIIITILMNFSISLIVIASLVLITFEVGIIFDTIRILIHIIVMIQFLQSVLLFTIKKNLK